MVKILTSAFYHFLSNCEAIFGMLETGCKIQDTRCEMRDARCEGTKRTHPASRIPHRLTFNRTSLICIGCLEMAVSSRGLGRVVLSHQTGVRIPVPLLNLIVLLLVIVIEYSITSTIKSTSKIIHRYTIPFLYGTDHNKLLCHRVTNPHSGENFSR